MPLFEYRVVPAPSKGKRAKGIKGPAARFSFSLQDLMNKMGAAGWEYQRAETLPSIERSGLTSTTTEWRNVLVFRREKIADTVDEELALLPAPEARAAPRNGTADTETADAPAKVASKIDANDDGPGALFKHPSDEKSETGPGAIRMLRDNGVEDVSDVSGITNSLKQLVASRSSNKPSS